MNIKNFFGLCLVALCAVACSDNDPVTAPSTSATQRLVVDATDYTQWHYIDLESQQVTTLPVGEPAPDEWDLAVHRYDVKTHGGAAVETAVSDFASLPEPSSFPTSAFVADEWTTDRLIVDMSQMMNGVVEYASDDYNPCLSNWLKLDTSSMPPAYTLSGKVYLLRLKDQTFAACRLVNFMNDQGVKGHLTIDYQYPVQP
ncbi:lipoprotein [gut metagenome]|uniref:Lipoprotein n=1 Tax=gut metagenome TaxID=749906 RepID=J9H3K3_9ZZZZ